MSSFTCGSLFSGIGGIDLACAWAGFTTAWFVEREPYCQQVLAKNFPGVPIHGDIFDCADLPHVDLLTAGFPCQPFSVAGKRQGRNDERFLIPEMLRVIAEVQPNVVLLENVPGFTSLTDGLEFRELLRALAKMGYDAQWGHLRASDVGAPHKRERWFCVAYAKGGDDKRISRTMAKAATITGQQNWGGITCCEGENVGNTQHNGHVTTELADGTSDDGQWNSANQLRQTQNRGLGREVFKHKRAIESRLGGNVNGLSHRVDEHPGWPARPGQRQYDYEPPRTTTRTDNRTARLKALGNAVVPQVVYPIALAIYAWLERQHDT